MPNAFCVVEFSAFEDLSAEKSSGTEKCVELRHQIGRKAFTIAENLLGETLGARPPRTYS